jgi:hypothetical protein
MTTHNYKVFKNYPVQMTIKNPRCWWQTINTAYGEDTTVDVEMLPFEGLEYTFNNPLITFSRQTLLDSTILEEHTYALGESGKEYAYGDGNTDINVIGTLTEADGVYSGFSTANYLETTTSPINTNRGEWEYMVKFTTGSDVSTSQRIVHALPAATTRYGTGVYVKSGKMDYLISFNGSSWGIDVDGTHTLSPNTTYWVRFSYKNQKYLGEISTDGVTFEEDYVVSNANTLYPSLPVLRFGVSYSTKYEAPFLGSIDLKECYFKAGDKFLWNYSHTKYYMGCLETSDKVSEYTYTALVKDGEVLLVDTDQLRTGYTWANGVTIPTHEKLLDNYFS